MWFKKRNSKLYTWKSPGERKRYQIDYILVKQHFRNSIRDVKTFADADIGSDHKLLVAEVQTRLKAWKRKPKWNLEKDQK
jgi:Metal-dependent hydrolase